MFLFKIDDYIMYGMTGVCKVMDITNERFTNGIKKEYYVLSPIYSNNTVIKIPVDNEKVPMRKLLSKINVLSLINDIPNMDTSWIDNEKLRSEQFKKILRSIDNNREYVKSIGKKTHQADDNIMKEAERLLNEEFATILDISPNEVSSYISSHIPQ